MSLLTTGTKSRLLGDWTPRIGRDAADLLCQSVQQRRAGLLFLGVFVVCEIGSQLADFRFGVAAAPILFIPAIICFVRSVKLIGTTTKTAGAYLGLTPYEAKYMRLRFTSTFDMWISKRDHPKFPKVTRFD